MDRLQTAELVKAIQAWTGSGVIGPIDVMRIPEARAKRCTGQGELGWVLLGLVGGGPGLGGLGCALLGWLLVGLGLR